MTAATVVPSMMRARINSLGSFSPRTTPDISDPRRQPEQSGEWAFQ